MSKFLSLPQKNKEKPAPSPAARPRPAAFHFKTNIQYPNQTDASLSVPEMAEMPPSVRARPQARPLAEPQASAGRGAFHVQSVTLVCVVLSGVQRAGCLCSSADLMSSLLSWCSEKRADVPAEEGAAAAVASSEVMMAAEGQEFGKSLVFAAPHSQPYCRKTNTATAAFAPTTQSPPTSWPQARTRWSSPSPTSQSTPWTGNCCLATYLAPKVIMIAPSSFHRPQLSLASKALCSAVHPLLRLLRPGPSSWLRRHESGRGGLCRGLWQGLRCSSVRRRGHKCCQAVWCQPLEGRKHCRRRHPHGVRVLAKGCGDGWFNRCRHWGQRRRGACHCSNGQKYWSLCHCSLQACLRLVSLRLRLTRVAAPPTGSSLRTAAQTSFSFTTAVQILISLQLSTGVLSMPSSIAWVVTSTSKALAAAPTPWEHTRDALSPLLVRSLTFKSWAQACLPRLLSSSRLGTLCFFYFIDISDGLPLPPVLSRRCGSRRIQ